MTEMFGEAWSPMSVPDLAPDDDVICANTLYHEIVLRLSFSDTFFYTLGCV